LLALISFVLCRRAVVVHTSAKRKKKASRLLPHNPRRALTATAAAGGHAAQDGRQRGARTALVQLGVSAIFSRSAAASRRRRSCGIGVKRRAWRNEPVAGKVVARCF